MENCKHVNKFNLAFNHSVLDPQKWHCHACGTNDTIWACLSCPNVACGILNKGDAFKHFKEKKHALTLEVNIQSIYCYECGDYVYNDNAASDLKVLRSALSAITTHNFLSHQQCSKRILRSSLQRSQTENIQRNHRHNKYYNVRSNAIDDKLNTAVCQRRQMILGKAFCAWKTLVLKLNVKSKSVAMTETKSKMPSCGAVHKNLLIPGVTGLRNLGNTCYMNSILQVLGHLDKFRHFFVTMPFLPMSGSHGSSRLSSVPHNSNHSNSSAAISSAINCRNFNHLNTRHSSTECFRRSSPRGGGLNGGATHQRSVHQKLLSISQTMEPKLLCPEKRVSLCEELSALFQVLWCGKWPVISPNALLQAVWSYIPAFRGYSQQDAQEFLSQLLDKVQTELDGLRYLKNNDVVADTFQGELVSEVTCQSCGHKCRTYEPFMDLSLEFPARYQRNSPNGKIARNVCHITEMLSHFTKPEYLEGNVYACDSCNSKRKRPNSSPKIYTEIKKQLMLSKLPHILRLHLKRFRWSKGNHREKIATHVSFENFLNMKPFCLPKSQLKATQCLYKLSAIIIHHGQGFGSGHYTAFCWSKEANSWIHCNDTRVQKVSMKEVYKSQVYILIFSLHSTKDQPTTDSCSLTTTTINNQNNNKDNDDEKSNHKVSNNDVFPSTTATHNSKTQRDTKNVVKNISTLNTTHPNSNSSAMTDLTTSTLDTLCHSTPPQNLGHTAPLEAPKHSTPTNAPSHSSGHPTATEAPGYSKLPSHSVPPKTLRQFLEAPSYSIPSYASGHSTPTDTKGHSKPPGHFVPPNTSSQFPSQGASPYAPDQSTPSDPPSHSKPLGHSALANTSSHSIPPNVPGWSTPSVNLRSSIPTFDTPFPPTLSDPTFLHRGGEKQVLPTSSPTLDNSDASTSLPINSSTAKAPLITSPPNNTNLDTSFRLNLLNHTAAVTPKNDYNTNRPFATTSNNKKTNLTPSPCLVHSPTKKSTSFLLQRLGFSSLYTGNAYDTRSKLPRLRSAVQRRTYIVPQTVSSVDRKRKGDCPQNLANKTKKHRITL